MAQIEREGFDTLLSFFVEMFVCPTAGRDDAEARLHKARAAKGLSVEALARLLTDGALIRLVRAGIVAQAAVAELYARYGGWIRSRFRQLGIQESDIDDLCQDFFVDLLAKGLTSFDTTRPFFCYLYKIVWRRFCDYVKTRATVLAAVAEDTLIEARESLRLLGDDSEAELRLQEVFDACSPMEQEVLHRYTATEATVEMIAQDLGLRKGQVYQIVERLKAAAEAEFDLPTGRYPNVRATR